MTTRDGKIKVLMVEDNSALTQATAKLFKQNGFFIKTTSSFIEALDMLGIDFSYEHSSLRINGHLERDFRDKIQKLYCDFDVLIVDGLVATPEKEPYGKIVLGKLNSAYESGKIEKPPVAFGCADSPVIQETQRIFNLEEKPAWFGDDVMKGYDYEPAHAKRLLGAVQEAERAIQAERINGAKR